MCPAGRQVRAGADALIERCEAAARERYATTRDFFDAAGIADGALLRALRKGVLRQQGGAADAEVKSLVGTYQEVFKRAQPNARQIDSVVKQIDRLGALLKVLAPDDATRRHLGALRDALGGSSRRPGDADRPAEKRAARRTTGDGKRAKKKPTRRKKGGGGVSS